RPGARAAGRSATSDGSRGEAASRPLDAPTGVGLSPAGDVLYVAETHTGRVWWWSVTGPGQVASTEGLNAGGHLLAGLPGAQLLDSLAVDEEGWVCVGTLGNGGITAISPDGSQVEHVPLPDLLVTNICFGGPDRRTAYATLSGTGKLISFDWPRPGLRLHFAR